MHKNKHLKSKPAKKMSPHKKKDILENLVAAQKKKQSLSLFFSLFAKTVADMVGNAYAFLTATLLIVVWLISGPYFHYSDTWQLIINTGTTIITFLIVFLIQNTQNRDTEIINIKLDELIKGHKGAKNSIIDLKKLSDEELKALEETYKQLCDKRTGD